MEFLFIRCILLDIYYSALEVIKSLRCLIYVYPQISISLYFKQYVDVCEIGEYNVAFI